jgi:hypothetical protein
MSKSLFYSFTERSFSRHVKLAPLTRRGRRPGGDSGGALRSQEFGEGQQAEPGSADYRGDDCVDRPPPETVPILRSIAHGAQPMPPRNTNDPNHWRDRAAQMRALALTMKDRRHPDERSCGRLRHARR